MGVKKYYYNTGTSNRYFQDDEYKEWRDKVKKRDQRICQMPHCYSRIKVECHHILKWADYPALRFDVNNGICLCRKCHQLIKGQEEYYAPLFMQIVSQNGKNNNNKGHKRKKGV